jgi:hypothetical protein
MVRRYYCDRLGVLEQEYLRDVAQCFKRSSAAQQAAALGTDVRFVSSRIHKLDRERGLINLL